MVSRSRCPARVVIPGNEPCCYYIFSVAVSPQPLPQTTAYVRITKQSWSPGQLEGEVRASDYQWTFKWRFSGGKLSIHPSLGRALIQEPLGRFLEQYDYHLEAGGDYTFTIRATF